MALTNTENLLMVLNKEIPEAIPTYSIFWGMAGSPSIFRNRTGNPDGTGIDYFGVEWVIDNSAFPAALPKPGVFILDDIRKWRDVIKMPDFSNVDWEEMAKKDREGFDPELPLGGRTVFTGFFQSLISFMGFTEGLVACLEEPEEVKELMSVYCDFACENARKYIQYYKPQYGTLSDDIAHEHDPFVSLETFRDLFAPYWRKYASVFLDAGIPVTHHNCGHFEAFAEDVADMGFTLWEPVQSSNDAVALKAKLGRNLALGGAFDPTPISVSYDVTEEEVRAFVKNRLDELAPGGGYAWFGGMFGDDPVSRQRNEWIQDEFQKLRGTYH
ncbi:MAG: veratrol--corrinoid protein metyltransferase [Eubacteriaceae bacterium]|nr:veratrol--corrinoid protein metyltransferase [Eubacteriaceae bacterium]